MELSKIITFRLSDEFASELQRRADKQSVSVHEVARRTLIAVLSDGAEEVQRRQLAEICDQVRRNREESLRVAHALLVRVGGVAEEAAFAYLQEIMGMSKRDRENPPTT